MKMSRSILLLSVFVLLSLFSSLVSAQDPTLYCSVFSFTPYTVSGTSLGVSLGSPISTTYGTVTYTEILNNVVDNNEIYVVTNPSSTGSVYYSVQYGIYFNGAVIQPKWVTNSSTGLASVFPYIAGGNHILITPFTHSSTANVTYLFVVNITQVITGPFGPNGQEARYDGCTYTDYIYITNPATAPGNTSGFGISSSTGSGGISGDPQFVGLRGQTFQIHGIDGAVYNLISDHDIQLNSRFSFLTGPRVCPAMPSSGKKSNACWTHPGSYLTELGLKTSSGDRLHIVSGDAATGFATVSVNDVPLKVGAVEELHQDSDLSVGYVSYNSTHEIIFSAGQFLVTVENIDGFLNLRSVHVHDWRSLESHGLLGQTWRAKRYSGKVKEIEGEVDDYVIVSDDIFGDNFIFNKHNIETA